MLFLESDHQDQLTAENVSFLESSVSRIADSFPDTVANSFVVESGESDEGELSEELPVAPSLPSDISIRDGELRITGSAGRDEITITENENDLIITSQGIETIIPRDSVSSYLLRAGDGDDLFDNQSSLPGIAFGGSGDDVLIGGSGIDSIGGEDGDDIIFGGDGDDLITGDGGADTINGGDGADRIRGGNGNDIIDGGDGDDPVLDGQGGNDVVRGSAGDDTVVGGIGNDELFGDDGDDRVGGGAGDDTIRGGLGDDTLQGDDGRDEVFGDAGIDRIRGGLGEDRLFVDLDDLLLDTDDDEIVWELSALSEAAFRNA